MGWFGKSDNSNQFFVQLNDISAHTFECIVQLEHLLVEPDNSEKKEKVRSLIHEIRELHHIILDDLHNSFITPIDREDIFNIAGSYLELSRYSFSTVEELLAFQIGPDEAMQNMIHQIRKQAEELHTATQRLEKNPRVATEHLNRVKEFEDEVEKTYRKAVFSLFESATADNLPAILLKREVYRHISNMSDKAMSAAKVLGMIVMKLS